MGNLEKKGGCREPKRMVIVRCVAIVLEAVIKKFLDRLDHNL
jgi:hypothetical protein